jgi:DNA-directed RNA polymerase subunit RPC12/RpoP
MSEPTPFSESPRPEAIDVSDGTRQFPCGKCGAKLDYAPGTTSLSCPYCGHENPIESSTGTVVEHDFEAQVAALERGSPTHETLTVKCNACAAEVAAKANATAFACPYCGNNIVAAAHSTKQIKPGALLPFKVRREQAREAFRVWLKSRWFAPNKLKHQAGIDESVTGVYMPYWTYDCRTTTSYSGARGDAYYTTESYTVMVNGKAQRQTRQVRKIRWSPASGIVGNAFDDVLVAASHSLPGEMVQQLEPWDLKHVVAYQDEYLSGFTAESYQTDLTTGFAAAKGIMEPRIRSTIRNDIGGDEQRIDRMDVRYAAIRFKHLLLPVWVSAYRYKGKVYRFLVNARTGEVQGDRPYSAPKIAALVIAVLLAIGIIVLIVSQR